MKYTITLKSIGEAYEFNAILQKFMWQVDVKQDHYTINGKSLMGLFSLDLSRPVILDTKEDDDEMVCYLLTKFSPRKVGNKYE